MSDGARPERYASYDIGSNTTLMLVAERTTSGAWVVVDDVMYMTRVAEGLDQTGHLGETPQARTREALTAMAARAQAHGVAHMVATGTAPFRRSSNGPEVARAFGDVIGCVVDVVSGEAEAELSLLATRRAFAHLHRMCVVDIGGASTEVIVADVADVATVSVDVGAVRLTERCVRAHPWTPACHQRVGETIAQSLDDAGVSALLAPRDRPMVGIAGTVTTLAAYLAKMDNYDAMRIHGSILSHTDVARAATELAALSIDERAALAGIPRGRADVLPAGAALLSALMERAGVAQLTVSDRGTRWGRLHQAFDPA